ncbi:MAG TPA: CHAD domain-containing protein [Pseudoxanthomonas sp.]|nr:CHAD domain-containing protein [Pseudoxanthomonas sp.]
MAFHLKVGEDVEKALRRIALAQIDCAVKAADHTARDAAPHAIRKQCKKLRGLLRLFRGSFDDYRVEQRTLRDTARTLAALREADAHLEALERLCSRDPARYQGPDFERARGWLRSRREALVRANEEDACIEAALAMLRAQRERVGQWTLRASGFDVIEDGVTGTYRQARDALAVACDDPTAHHLHELRKQVKYHRFHLDLLHKLWPGPIAAVAHEARELGEILGEHHDIDVLIAVLAQGDAGLEINEAGHRIAVAARPERERLEANALCLARRLMAERPRSFGRRMRGYWEAWRS